MQAPLARLGLRVRRITVHVKGGSGYFQELPFLRRHLHRRRLRLPPTVQVEYGHEYVHTLAVLTIVVPDNRMVHVKQRGNFRARDVVPNLVF